jgi:hypothetical protein
MARPIDRDKEQFWGQMFARWTASGLSIAAFCEEAGLSQQSFYRWRRVLRKRTSRADQQRQPQAVDAATEKAATAIARPLPLFVPLGSGKHRSGCGPGSGRPRRPGDPRAHRL